MLNLQRGGGRVAYINSILHNINENLPTGSVYGPHPPCTSEVMLYYQNIGINIHVAVN